MHEKSMNETSMKKTSMKKTPDRRQKVQSVEVGMKILLALMRIGPRAPLLRIAEATAMPSSKVHRYLKALISSGLVSQDVPSGHYQLGPEALAIGFTAIGWLDVVNVSARSLAELRDRVKQSCSLSVWGNKGPTVVRIEVEAGTIILTTRIGTVAPLLTTASGLVFAAFQQDEQVRNMMDSEAAELVHRGRADLLEAAKLSIAQARQCGLAAATNTLTPGVNGISAPIFDHQRKLAAVMTVFGPTGFIDVSVTGPVARELYAAAAATGKLLGCPPDALPSPTGMPDAAGAHAGGLMERIGDGLNRAAPGRRKR